MASFSLITTSADIVEIAASRCAALGLVRLADQPPPGAQAAQAVQRQGRRFLLALDPAGQAPALLFEAGDVSEAELSRLELSLSWMASDLMAMASGGRIIDGFTTELTATYESLELLGAVGRAMREPQRPRQFISRALRALLESTEFGWAATWMGAGELAPPEVAGELIGLGRAGPLDPALTAPLESLGRTTGAARQIAIIECGEALPASAGLQIVSHPLLREEGSMGLLLVGAKGGADPMVTSFDTGLIENVAGHISSYLATAALYAAQRAMFIGTVQAITAAIDAKDRYTCGHSARVARLAAQLTVKAGFGESYAERIHVAGLVHDVGKIGVPEGILRKTSRLTKAEFDHIKRHPRIGYEILKDIPALREELPAVLHHHERWDGGGYPDGLAGEDIPLQARILALADSFDAMSSTRSYRPAMPRPQALAEVARCAGSQFDPELAPVFLSLDFAEYDAMVIRARTAA